MRDLARPLGALAALTLFVTLVTVASAAGAGAPDPDAARSYFTDTVLINQDGEEMRFYSDLLEGKVAVINVLFTHCAGSCPVMSRKYAALQEHLGDRLGSEVNLISITVDPDNDSPAALKRHGDRFGARSGWYLLTGSAENVERVLAKLGQWVEEPEAHQNLFLIGNDRTGLWKKAFGLAPTEELIAIVDSVLEDPGIVEAGEVGDAR